MLGTISANEFEQLVYKITSILESAGATVTWNASIPDPDCPNNPRQIDILIEKDGRKTHVECRFRKGRQSSNWIEELYGRKVSLKVDSIIGVSFSGFSKPAIIKAKSLGVIIRDFRSITEDEITTWGSFAKVEVHYVQLIKPKVEIFITESSKPVDETEEEYKKYILALEEQKILSVVFSNFAKKADRLAHEHNIALGAISPVFVSKLYFPEKMNVLNRDLSLINLSCRCRLVVGEMNVAYAGLYGAPEAASDSQDAMIQKFPSKGWGLIKTDKEAFLKLDVASIPHPENCILTSFKIVGVNAKEPKKTEKYILEQVGYDDYKPMENLDLEIDIFRKNIAIPSSITPNESHMPDITILV